MSKPQQPPRELVSFLESLSEPHILCDRNYRILAANEAYRVKWVGQREVVGRTCYEVSHRYSVPCDQAGESCPLQRSLRSGQRERIVHLHHTHLGEQFENIELTPIRDDSGEIAYYIEKLDPLPVQRSEEHARGLLGRSPAFLAMMEMVARVAPSDAAVLLQGESGTGKELVARCLHDASPRARGNFVAINCGGLPETLFDSEIFGHEAGAYTGAGKRRIGKIEHANGGTLFLDEIETMPVPMQIKLLRVLQERTLERLGSNTPIPVDCRVIAATKEDLLGLSEQGRFRADLYYRLSVATLPLPPLRERREDIPLLFEHFLLQAAARHERAVPATPPGRIQQLVGYAWPGNVRELRNVADRCVLGIEAGSPPFGLAAADSARPLNESVEAFERALIADALRRHGSLARTAEALAIAKTTLHDKIRKYGLGEGSPA